MQGHPDVIDYLNTLLTGELAARDQYFIHSRMYEDWGFTKLYERINHEMEEDAARRCADAPDPDARRHATHARTIWKWAPPCLRCSRPTCARVQSPRRAVQGHRAVRAAQGLRQPRHPARSVGDTEEDHTYWLEKQLGLIKAIGLENYLQSQT
jgi:bacterioferritin